MGESTLHKHIRIRAPIETIFERVTDHEAMTRWPGIAEVRLVTAGQPRNGLGAVRSVRVTAGLTLLEEVVHFEPPHRYDYTIIRGLPVDHLGSVRLAARGDEVELEWKVRMQSRWPLLARTVAWQLGRGLDAALAYFKSDVELASSDSRG